MRDDITLLSATGMLGSGFAETSLKRAMAMGPAMIGCDAGSTDGGPYALATGEPRFPRAAVKRDFSLLLGAALEAKIPLIIGSAGSAGADANVDVLLSIIDEIVAEKGHHFRMAVIRSEVDQLQLHGLLAAGRIRALPPSGPVTEEELSRSLHVVAMMGVEPLQRALEAGAQVIIAGRCSDTAIYAALPLMQGYDPGVAWHAGKILDCGAACVEHRAGPDSMVAILHEGAFDIVPPRADYQCTPQSVASQVLYENTDPHHIIEPSGVLLTENCEYQALDDRSVRVSGSRFQVSDEYTVKLEGVRSAGWSSIFCGGIRDPFILKDLGEWVDRFKSTSEQRFKDLEATYPEAANEIQMNVRIYGSNGVMGEREPEPDVLGHEVLLLCDLLSPSQELSHAAAAVAFHIALHNPISKWAGSISAIASPFAPAVVDRGEVYEFSLNHVAVLQDPHELFQPEFVEK
jgi:hypothetical protein